MKSLRHALILALTVVACSAGGTGTGSESGPPVKQGEVVSPTTGLRVSATIVAATLGEDCGGGGAQAPAQGDFAGKCAPDAGTSCGSFCQQSNVQLSFTANAGGSAAKIEIISVTLHDASTGDQVDKLTSRDPKAWTGSGYAAWDQIVKPSTETKASYNLSAPAWSKIGNSYSQKYKLHVTVQVDGAAITLESTTLSREPAVAT